MYVKHKILFLAATGCLVLLPIKFASRVLTSNTNNTIKTVALESQDDGGLVTGNVAASLSTPASSGAAAAPTRTVSQLPAEIETVSLKIPSIGLNAPVIRTGLEADGSLHVPSDPKLAGWYTGGPKPGQNGPAVITGHYDSAAGPGVFYTLKKAAVGDLVLIGQTDGSTLDFRIEREELYPQDAFPTDLVYGPIASAGLRIITCAGTYNPSTKHYSHDLVVYASLIADK